MLNYFEITGRASSHVIDIPELQCRAQREAAAAMLCLREAAARESIDLTVASGFRDFDSQLAIWQRKWRGERPLLDAEGRPIDAAQLDELARRDAILCWSALPGASRHHWGTEFDVYDRAAMPAEYRLQLTPEEYAADGVFADLSAWLHKHAASYGFYWPYDQDRGGVRPEPWHLSYAPLAYALSAQVTPDILREALLAADMDGRDCVLADIDVLQARYVAQVGVPSQQVLGMMAPFA